MALDLISEKNVQPAGNVMIGRGGAVNPNQINTDPDTPAVADRRMRGYTPPTTVPQGWDYNRGGFRQLPQPNGSTAGTTPAPATAAPAPMSDQTAQAAITPPPAATPAAAPVAPIGGTMSITGSPGAVATIGPDGQVQESAAWKKATPPINGIGGTLNVMTPAQDKAISADPNFKSAGGLDSINNPGAFAAQSTGGVPTFESIQAQFPGVSPAIVRGYYNSTVLPLTMKQQELGIAQAKLPAELEMHHGMANYYLQHGNYMSAQAALDNAKEAHQAWLISPEGQKQAQLLKGREPDQELQKEANSAYTDAIKKDPTDIMGAYAARDGVLKAAQGYVPLIGSPAVPADKGHLFGLIGGSPAKPATPTTWVPPAAAPPAGMTQVGTSGGRPVYSDAQGNKHW